MENKCKLEQQKGGNEMLQFFFNMERPAPDIMRSKSFDVVAVAALRYGWRRKHIGSGWGSKIYDPERVSMLYLSFVEQVMKENPAEQIYAGRNDQCLQLHGTGILIGK